MKYSNKSNSIIFAIFLFCNGLAIGQNCFQGSANFNSQSALESEMALYPNCTKIAKNVNIYNVTDLSSLANITEIEGNLQIYDSPDLTDLKGLEQLEKVTGHISISETRMTEINFPSLKQVSSFLRISNNDVLRKIVGFDLLNLTNSITIFDNPNLVQVSGFNNLIEIDRSIDIDAKESLEVISGFNSIRKLEELSIISNNGALSGFNNLELTESNLICNNFSVIDAFEKLVSTRNLDLENSFVAPNLFDNLKTVTGELTLNGITNSDSLNCFNSLESCKEIYIVDCHFKHLSGFNLLTSTSDDFTISYNDELKSINGFSNLEKVFADFDIDGNDELIRIDGFQKLDSIGFNFAISSNPLLSNVESFENISYAGGSLKIKDNDSLLDLSFLKSLNRVVHLFQIEDNENLIQVDEPQNFNRFRQIRIKNNPSLVSISSFKEVDPDFIESLNISDNLLLPFCEYDNFCEYLRKPDAGFYIQDNGFSCDAYEFSCVDIISDVNDLNQDHNISVYPNPTSDNVTINFESSTHIDAEVSIYNILGARVSSMSISFHAGINSKKLNLDMIESGLHIIEITVDKHRYTTRFMKI